MRDLSGRAVEAPGERQLTTETQAPEPPPFDPDPDLITDLERGDKPTREEIRELTER